MTSAQVREWSILTQRPASGCRQCTACHLNPTGKFSRGPAAHRPHRSQPSSTPTAVLTHGARLLGKDPTRSPSAAYAARYLAKTWWRRALQTVRTSSSPMRRRRQPLSITSTSVATKQDRRGQARWRPGRLIDLTLAASQALDQQATMLSPPRTAFGRERTRRRLLVEKTD